MTAFSPGQSPPPVRTPIRTRLACHDRVDLDRRALRQGGDADGGPGGWVCIEERGVCLVDLGEGAEFGRVDRQAHRAIQAGPRALADRLQVLQAAGRLLAGRGADKLARVGVERYLPRTEDKVAGADGVTVGPDGLGGAGGVE